MLSKGSCVGNNIKGNIVVVRMTQKLRTCVGNNIKGCSCVRNDTK